MKRIITYGSFDLLHYGHIELLRRAKAMGDYLIVALSTDEFSASKGKRAYFTYEQRKAMLEAVRYVDMVVPEQTWGQGSSACPFTSASCWRARLRTGPGVYGAGQAGSVRNRAGSSDRCTPRPAPPGSGRAAQLRSRRSRLTRRHPRG